MAFENHRKSLIQHCERSELRLHFEWTKVHQKCQKLELLKSANKGKTRITKKRQLKYN